MKNVVVKENHLTFGGVAYFRAHAEEVEIGSIGEKRKPLFKQNYLEVKDRLLIPESNIVKATEAEIDFINTSKKSFKLKAAAIINGVPVKLGGDAVFNKLRSGELKLVKFSIANNDLKEIANNSSGSRSIVFGKAIDHIEELKIVLSDGQVSGRSVGNCDLPSQRR